MTKSHRTRGSCFVESALIFGLFVQIVFGTIEAARFMYFYNWVSYAAREGTRWASVRGTTSGHQAAASDVQTFVKNQAVTYDPANVTVLTTWSPDEKPGSTVTVEVEYAYRPLIGFIFQNSLTLNAQSKSVISQ